jgi:hypothetical protein
MMMQPPLALPAPASPAGHQIDTYVYEGEIVDDRYVADEPVCCDECEHFHPVDGPCLMPGKPCGSYLCCIN